MGIPAEIAYYDGRRDVAEEILAEAKRMTEILHDSSMLTDKLKGLWMAIRIADQEFYEEIVSNEIRMALDIEGD